MIFGGFSAVTQFESCLPRKDKRRSCLSLNFTYLERIALCWRKPVTNSRRLFRLHFSVLDTGLRRYDAQNGKVNLN